MYQSDLVTIKYMLLNANELLKISKSKEAKHHRMYLAEHNKFMISEQNRESDSKVYKRKIKKTFLIGGCVGIVIGVILAALL